MLMVRQYVKRGDIVWNYPGGGIEVGESPEQACIREIREETGFEIRIVELMSHVNDKSTFIAEIIGGTLKTEFNEDYNEDILEVKWINTSQEQYFDTITKPIRDEFLSRIEEVPDII